MNRAEYEVIINRIKAVEARCELLEQRQLKAESADFDPAVRIEQQERVTSKSKSKGF